MPIEVRVVDPEVYSEWIELMKAGDFDAAFAAVSQTSTVSMTEPTDANTRLAQAQ